MSTSTADSLLNWYDSHRRVLPWREDPSPYHVWISEIMLQQTRVEAVKRYYERFLKALPGIEDLANAPEEQCLKLWEGLGYYSRVRNMRRAAQEVVSLYGGVFPSSSREIRKLPGIGPYTAAAIASIAYGEAVPAVDGNLLRVFARLTKYEESIRSQKAAKKAEEFFVNQISKDRPGDYNQAMMDLGATVCLPNAVPKCGECPLREDCAANREGIQTQLPVIPAKSARKQEKKTIFLIRSGDRTAIRRRPARGLLAGLYEFPSTDGWLTGEEAVRFLLEKEIPALRVTPLPPAKHVFTHKEWHMIGFEVITDSSEEDKIPYLMASSQEIREKYSVPSAFSVYLKYLYDHPESTQKGTTENETSLNSGSLL